MSSLCNLCNINDSLYVCPRCNVPYCSLVCYRGNKHLECSESFYKDQILATLSSQSEEEKTQGQQSMEEILMRLHATNSKSSGDLDSDDDDEDEDSEDELNSRLAGVSLDDADAVWQRLTASERTQFEKLLQTGGITDLLPEFNPWWTVKLVEDIPSTSDQQETLDSKVNSSNLKPPVIKDVPNFKSICKKKPSPSLPFNTANIVGAYVYTVRCFNGEHMEWPSHAAYTAWSLSETLSNSQNFENMLDAVTSISVNMTQKENASEEDISTMKADTKCIISSAPQLPVALSDLLVLFRAALKHRPPTAKGPFTQRFPDGADNQLPRDKLKLTIKKLEFYLSWVLQESNISDNK